VSKGWQRFVCILEGEILVYEVQQRLRVRHKRLIFFFCTLVLFHGQFSYFTHVIYRVDGVMFSLSIPCGVI
jgi:hypothetical protein